MIHRYRYKYTLDMRQTRYRTILFFLSLLQMVGGKEIGSEKVERYRFESDRSVILVRISQCLLH